MDFKRVVKGSDCVMSRAPVLFLILCAVSRIFVLSRCKPLFRSSNRNTMSFHRVYFDLVLDPIKKTFWYDLNNYA